MTFELIYVATLAVILGASILFTVIWLSISVYFAAKEDFVEKLMNKQKGANDAEKF